MLIFHVCNSYIFHHRIFLPLKPCNVSRIYERWICSWSKWATWGCNKKVNEENECCFHFMLCSNFCVPQFYIFFSYPTFRIKLVCKEVSLVVTLGGKLNIKFENLMYFFIRLKNNSISFFTIFFNFTKFIKCSTPCT
jgi:hypothetical protein